MQAAGQALGTVWRNVDARRLLKRENDPEFIGALRGHGDTQARAQLRPMRDEGARLKEALRDGTAEQPATQEIVSHFEKRLDELDSVLQGLEQDKPWATRAAIYGAMNVLLPILPMAVAVKTGQNKFLAELSGMYAKTALMAIGSVRSPTAADRHMVGDHFMQRHFLTLIQTGMFVVPTFTPKLEHLNDNAGYNVGAAVLTTLAAIGAFFHREIGEKWNTQVHGSLNPKLQSAWQDLGAGTRAELGRLLDDVRASASTAKDNIAADRAEFEQQGNALSPYTATQVNLVADALLLMGREVDGLIGARAHDLEAQHAPEEAANPHWRAKMALALLNVAVGTTVTALMVPDWIGVGGNAGDTLVTGAIGMRNALSAHTTREDAMDSFRSWSGLSIIMVGMLAASRARGDFINEGGPTGAVVGALSLAILNSTLPGPLGHLLGSGLEKVMNARPQDLWAFVGRVGQAAENLFAQRAEALNLPERSSVRIEELHSEIPPGAATQAS